MLFERSIKKTKERPFTDFPPKRLREVGSPFGRLFRMRDCSSATTEPTSMPDGIFLGREGVVVLDCAAHAAAAIKNATASTLVTERGITGKASRMDGVEWEWFRSRKRLPYSFSARVLAEEVISK